MKQTTNKGLKPVERDTPLGTKMRDRVTGFVGIAVGKIVYMNGCVQFALKPTTLTKEGKPLDSSNFDFEQLEIVDNGLAPKEKKEKVTGGVMPDTPDVDAQRLKVKF